MAQFHQDTICNQLIIDKTIDPNQSEETEQQQQMIDKMDDSHVAFHSIELTEIVTDESTVNEHRCAGVRQSDVNDLEILEHARTRLFGVGDHNSTTQQQQSTFVVISSSEYLKDHEPAALATIFVDLFPFERGVPDEHRRVAMSPLHCIQRYLQLASRKFAEHETFVMTAFDIEAR